MTAEEPSYIDYDTFLSPDFSPTAFANDLVLSTNDPTDTTLDLSTPLSRVLFDVQEIDIHIDNLTTKSAVPLLDYTQIRSDASSRILDEVSTQLASLNEGYSRLEKDVIERYEKAEQVRLAAERLCQTLRLGRVASRCLNLGRQLETQMEDLGISASSALTSSTITTTNTPKIRENHTAMVGAAQTVVELTSIFGNMSSTPGLERITTVTALRNNLVTPLERSLVNLAQQTIREFSVSSVTASTASSQSAQTSSYATEQAMNPTFLQSEQAKSRTTSALSALYLLSPSRSGTKESAFEPRLLLTALSSYLQANLTSSVASLARALATLPTLERTLSEVGGRCANIVALEQVLATTRRGHHPNLTTSRTADSQVQPAAVNGTKHKPDLAGNKSADEDSDSSLSDSDEEEEDQSATTLKTTSTLDKDLSDEPLLPLLLHSLDTNSLASYFWRTLASNLTARVVEILNRGGVSARTLRSNKDRVAHSVRECVLKSSRGIEGKGSGGEREAAVMVGSIVGVLGR